MHSGSGGFRMLKAMTAAIIAEHTRLGAVADLIEAGGAIGHPHAVAGPKGRCGRRGLLRFGRNRVKPMVKIEPILGGHDAAETSIEAVAARCVEDRSGTAHFGVAETR